MVYGVKNGFVLSAAVFLAACMQHDAPQLTPVPGVDVSAQSVQVPPPISPLADFMAAAIAESSMNLQDAAKHYGDFVTHSAQSGSRYVERALVYAIAAGMHTRAKTLAEQSIASSEASPMAFIYLAARALKNQHWQQAQDYLRVVAEAQQDNLPFYVLQSYARLGAGNDFAHVLEPLQAVQPIPVLESMRQFHLSKLYGFIGDEQKAAQAAHQAFLFDRTSFLSVENAAHYLRASGKHEEATKTVNAFLAENPQYTFTEARATAVTSNMQGFINRGVAEVLFALGALMQSQDMYLTARQMMEIAYYLDADFDVGNAYYGSILASQREQTQAIAFLERVDITSPVGMASSLKLIDLYENTSQSAKSDALLHKLEMLYPQQSMVRQMGAEVLFNRGDYQGAIGYYSGLISAADTYALPPRTLADVMFMRGVAYHRAENTQAAVDDLKKAISLYPHNPETLNYLGYIWLDNKTNIEQAFEHISRAAALRPNDGAIMDSLGWAYYHKGNYDKAVNLLERAAELMPNDTTVHRHLGDVYEKLGRTAEAKLQWQRALQFGPENAKHRSHLLEKLGELQAANQLDTPDRN